MLDQAADRLLVCGDALNSCSRELLTCEVKKDCPALKPQKKIRRGPWFAFGLTVGVVVTGLVVGLGVWAGVR